MTHHVEQWNRLELTLESSTAYAHPDRDVEITALFLGESGATLTLAGFWDGGTRFAVRFAPPEAGRWTYVITASDPSNAGLHAVGDIRVRPYSGDLDIYRRGFVRVSDDGRGFAYADGRPFFWLGNTHWQAFNYERLHESNDPYHECSSQFACTVDRDLERGFTVYQTYPDAAVNDGGGNVSFVDWWQDRYTRLNPAAFRERFDVMMDHLTDRGLVVALGMGVHTQSGRIGAEAMSHFAKYVTARYAAYPVVWITGQEVDIEDEVGNLSTWRAVAETIADHDGYRHPLGAHMSTHGEPTVFADEPWHDWFPTQGGHTSIRTQAHYRFYWDERPSKPYLETEANYEGIWEVTTDDTRRSAWKALQTGSHGYTYGAAGVWGIKWDHNAPGWDGFQNGTPWFDGVRLPGGDQMGLLKDFYLGLGDRWPLTPRFGDEVFGSFDNAEESVLATASVDTYVVYFYASDTATGMLANMRNTRYTARWFDPRSGEWRLISDEARPSEGRWVIPNKPDEADWVLLVEVAPSR